MKKILKFDISGYTIEIEFDKEESPSEFSLIKDNVHIVTYDIKDIKFNGVAMIYFDIVNKLHEYTNNLIGG